MPSSDDPTDTPAATESRFVTTFDPDAGEQASEAIITAVAALSDTRPVELTPLYESVEPDAIDALVSHARRADTAGTHQLQFRYEGFDVDVRTDGRIQIRDVSVPTRSNST
ncbi:HalOD1 output domain-containing protein [Natronorubrum sulfidifaciens]|uniref:Halobacterial output domain-containing protein n=1 Tax=Natronorubrum sulfidifaciens JCM 14089 TaxID=1230460 RepID=L9WBA7_9EURY|nr:HalOD1 output domain-containing protein [Natronorubrum sulfidifaciens]ELY46785.1 hypothetical protein C495_06743 [Natronorubrum sulfidifaciens JCM 14089]